MNASQTGTWRAEGTDLARAASGGLLFGVPLLYTMEVWWTGAGTKPPQMVMLLVLLTVPIFVLNRTAGFRAVADARTVDAAADTIEAIAVGLVVTAVVLTLLREIDADTSVELALGKTIYEAVPFCLGIGFARHFLRGDRAASDDGASSGSSSTRRRRAEEGSTSSVLADFGASTLGATFIALSIAPTDEVPMIASAMSPPWLLLMVGASLLASYGIVFAAGFSGQDKRRAHRARSSGR